MAELASGAVSSLLGVIRNERQLLDRVGSDVQFIREEMESMNSFLLHLTRTAAAAGPRAGAGGEHDEQVRTWMNQVRVLAQDCNNCIDLYLYRGNRDIHLGKEPLLRCLRWLPWFLRKTLAQHRAAMELAVLKERARDVGKRRLRYGVEVPKKGAAAAAEGGGEAAAFVDLDDDGQDQDWHDQAGTRAADGSGGLRVTRALFRIYSVEDYLNDKLGDWIRLHQEHRDQRNTPCIAVVVPDTEKDSGAVAREALAAADKHGVKNTILVDISAMHLYSELGPKNTLYYILRVLQGQGTGQGKGGEGVLKRLRRKRRIRHEKRKVIGALKENIAKMKVTDKVEEMKKQIDQVKDSQLQPYVLSGTPMEVKEEEDDNDKNMEKKISGEQSLALLLVLLLRSSAADETNKKDMSRSIHTKFYDHIMKTAAKKLKEHMEQVNQEGGANQKIILKIARYEDILQEVFPKTNKRQQAQEQDTEQGATSAVTLGQDQIKEIVDKVKQEALREVFKAILQQDQVEKMIDKAKQEILQQVSQDKSNKEQPTGVPAGGQGSTAEALTEETKEKGQQATGEQKTIELLDSIKKTIEKIRYMPRKIERQLVMAGIVDKINKEHLDRAKATLIILKIDDKYVDEWDKIRNALSMLPNIAVVMILAKTEDIQTRAKQYCHPIEKPINYSLAALYHEIVLEITSQQKNEDNCDPQIFSTILDKCGPHELCWKIFAHTLYAKPRRSKEELHKLYNSLEAVPTKSFRGIALKMFKFSYRDMSKEYQSCLLYLAIFPRGYKIRRSTLIGRWVAEGLITTDDWRWSSSVEKAEHCFEELFARWFVYSADISATGRVKSCKVGDLVHDFITEIAKKQRIVETRLSYHLARYFSIFNEIHLRGSDKIEDFLERLSKSSRWSRLKVLDLEGCQCFWKNRSYLKNICKIMLLKYLSLRGTDVNWLPTEINNLRELEVLDIRQTHVPMIATENIIILKLKRLLAGHTNPSPSSTTETGISFPNHVLVPGKIEKMLEMEVLSNVKAKSNQDLQDIGKLWRLRKLGVVIDDKVSRFNNLLEAISNLHECLRSLSITLEIVRKSTSSIIPLKEPNKYLKDSPKILESLSISGTIQPEQLLCLLCTHLTKVTLSNMPVNMKALSELPILYCLRLRYNTYDNKKLVFNPSGFKKLKYFLVEGFNEIDEIRFEDRAVPELEKIVLYFTNMEPITFAGRVDQLPNLKELELNKTRCITAIADHSPDSEATAAAAAAAATAVDSDTSTALHPTLPATAAASTDLALSSPTVAAAQGPNPVAIATDPAPLAAAATDAGTNSPPSASTANNTMPFSKLLGDAKQIAKVTLRGTMLKQGDLRFLAKIANIRCLELLDESCDESHLAFKKDEFPKLNALIVNCSRITDIKFNRRACPKLEKIVWTFTKVTYFSGINNLLRLKELEFNGDSPLPDQVIKEAIDKHKDKIHCTYYKQEIQEKTLGNTEEKLHGAPCCPLILKGKRWHWTSS